MENFVDNVKAEMASRGMTITDLAAELGMARQGLSRVLQGRNAVTLTTASRIADALSVDLATLVCPPIETICSKT